MTENALPRVLGHCPNCGTDRNADVVGHYVGTDPTLLQRPSDYRILRCRGCEQAYFQMEIRPNPLDPDGSIFHWPVPIERERPAWFEPPSYDYGLYHLLNEVYSAWDLDLAVLAAIGIRTVFDRASKLLGINPELSFARKLDMLAASGKIGADERLILNVLTDAGSAAAHRGWKPSESEVEAMIEIIEAFIHRSFVLGKAATRLEKGVPPDARRKGGSGQTP